MGIGSEMMDEAWVLYGDIMTAHNAGDIDSATAEKLMAERDAESPGPSAFRLPDDFMQVAVQVPRQEGRWFLAHSKSVEVPRLELWSKQLTKKLETDEWSASVTTGRDDYEARAMALGGWKRWCDDIGCCRKYDGQPMYHGVIVPLESSSAVVGRATASIVQGFLDQQKHAYAWDLIEFKRILRVESTGIDNWQAHARLILE